MAARTIPLTDSHRPGGLVAMTYPAGDAAVIVLDGSLQGTGFAALDSLVTEALDHGHRHLVLDLHDLRSLDPVALGLLWAALRGVRRRGGTLAAARAGAPVRHALEALGSGGLMLYDTVHAARSAFEAPDGRP